MSLDSDCVRLIDRIISQVRMTSLSSNNDEGRLREAFGTMVRALDKNHFRSVIIKDIDLYFGYFQDAMSQAQIEESSYHNSEAQRKVSKLSLRMCPPADMHTILKSNPSTTIDSIYGLYLANSSFETCHLAELLMSGRDDWTISQLRPLLTVFYLRLATHSDWISAQPVATSCLLGLCIAASWHPGSLWKYTLQFPSAQLWTLGFTLFWNDRLCRDENACNDDIYKSITTMVELSFPKPSSQEERDLLRIKVPVWSLLYRFVKDRDLNFAAAVAKSLYAMVFCQGLDPREFVHYFDFENSYSLKDVSEPIFLDLLSKKADFIQTETLMAFMKENLLLEGSLHEMASTQVEDEPTREVGGNIDYEVDVSKSIVESLDECLAATPSDSKPAASLSTRSKRRRLRQD